MNKSKLLWIEIRNDIKKGKTSLKNILKREKDLWIKGEDLVKNR